MRLIFLMLALLLCKLALLGALFVLEEPAAVTGMAHPAITAMNAGGDGLARLGRASVVVGLLGASSLGLMLLLTVLGVAPDRRTGLFWMLFTLVLVASQGVWWAMYLGYLDFLVSGSVAYAFGFPAPTSWMLFGVWLSGSLLCLVYIFGFRRFIFSEADEAAYEALRAEAAVPRVPAPTDAGAPS